MVHKFEPQQWLLKDKLMWFERLIRAENIFKAEIENFIMF